jgi:pimeloyl-ACP methyl ester carboxylesterase
MPLPSPLLEQERTMKAAGISLLDKIGPAILIAYSQGGTFAWSWADARPNHIKALVQIEPIGPPFGKSHRGKASSFSSAIRPWALTSISLTYSPEPKDMAVLLSTKIVPAESPDFFDCVLQEGKQDN